MRIGGALVGRLALEPGWRWTEYVKSIVKTEWFEAPHLQYQLSGILHIQMSDGIEFDTVKGQVSWLPAGHDAWVVGYQTVVLVDFAAAMNFAK